MKKALFVVIISLLTCGALEAQAHISNDLSDVEGELWIEQHGQITHLDITYDVSKADYKNKRIKDSLYNTVYSHIPEAIRGKYQQIIIIISASFLRQEQKVFWTNKLIKAMLADPNKHL
jgi:hypothetical protein